MITSQYKSYYVTYPRKVIFYINHSWLFRSIKQNNKFWLITWQIPRRNRLFLLSNRTNWRRDIIFSSILLIFSIRIQCVALLDTCDIFYASSWNSLNAIYSKLWIKRAVEHLNFKFEYQWQFIAILLCIIIIIYCML